MPGRSAAGDCKDCCRRGADDYCSRTSALAQTQTTSTPVLSFEIASIKAGNAVPFPRPLLLLEHARTLLQKRKLCPKNFCHERGSPQVFQSIFGPIQEGDCATFSAVSDARCSTYLIFTAFLTAVSLISSQVAGVDLNRGKSASSDQIGLVRFSFSFLSLFAFLHDLAPFT